eukprot:Opistho-2@48805
MRRRLLQTQRPSMRHGRVNRRISVSHRPQHGIVRRRIFFEFRRIRAVDRHRRLIVRVAHTQIPALEKRTHNKVCVVDEINDRMRLNFHTIGRSIRNVVIPKISIEVNIHKVGSAVRLVAAVAVSVHESVGIDRRHKHNICRVDNVADCFISSVFVGQIACQSKKQLPTATLVAVHICHKHHFRLKEFGDSGTPGDFESPQIFVLNRVSHGPKGTDVLISLCDFRYEVVEAPPVVDNPLICRLEVEVQGNGAIVNSDGQSECLISFRRCCHLIRPLFHHAPVKPVLVGVRVVVHAVDADDSPRESLARVSAHDPSLETWSVHAQYVPQQRLQIRLPHVIESFDLRKPAASNVHGNVRASRLVEVVLHGHSVASNGLVKEALPVNDTPGICTHATARLRPCRHDGVVPCICRRKRPHKRVLGRRLRVPGRVRLLVPRSVVCLDILVVRIRRDHGARKQRCADDRRPVRKKRKKVLCLRLRLSSSRPAALPRRIIFVEIHSVSVAITGVGGRALP